MDENLVNISFLIGKNRLALLNEKASSNPKLPWLQFVLTAVGIKFVK